MLLSLKLSQFRCFEQLRLELRPGVNALVGANAQGKTSILEAICVLLRLQSPRTSVMGELVRFGQNGFGVAGRWGRDELHVVFQRRRRLQANGVDLAKTRDYLELSGLVVWMGNDDAELITGGGSPRRRYLDFLASQILPGYRSSLLAYERALQARNRLLKEDRLPWPEIDAYGQVLLRHGERLSDGRKWLVEMLNPLATRAQQAISGSKESLRLEYRSGSGQDFALALEEARAADAKRAQTTLGPHRDDLHLLVDERPAAKFASEGQQRTIALALKLAQVDLLHGAKASAPVLLIDDIFGELDPERRHALLAALPANGQKILTTTSTAWLPEHREIDPALFRVENGGVVEMG